MSEVFGVDVSHHNGRIDWERVAASGKKFAIMKCQYEARSHRIDETFEYNYAYTGKNGLARGVYIYIGPQCIEDPAADANALLDKLDGRTLEYGIWLDLEDSRIRGLGKEKFNRLVETYAKIFKAAGYYVGIYCNLDWYKNVLDSKSLEKTYDFWIARYPRDDKGVYNPESKLRPTNCVAWQYSSKGSVPGIDSRVDLNVDFDGIINLVNKPVEEKPANPDLDRYKVGNVYTLNANMYVRKEPNGTKLKFKELSPNGKAHGKADPEGSAVLIKGTKVTCKEVAEAGAIWMRIPSGWVCAKAASGKLFIS